MAYDEDQKRIEQLEMELQILKKLEAKQKEQVKLLQKQLKTSAKAADGIEDLIEGSIKEKEIVSPFSLAAVTRLHLSLPQILFLLSLTLSLKIVGN